MDYQAKARQYRKMNIETAGSLDLVVMCYEKVIEMLHQARKHFEGAEYEQKARKLQKALDIIHELQTCLNFQQGGQIARNLDSLYNYMVRRLLDGDVKKDIRAYEEVINILAELKEAWEGIAKQRVEEANGVARKPQSGLNLEQLAA